MNPLLEVFPQYETNMPDVFFQALKIKDAIEQAKKYNQTWTKVCLFGSIHPENKMALIENGFAVDPGAAGDYHISWERRLHAKRRENEMYTAEDAQYVIGRLYNFRKDDWIVKDAPFLVYADGQEYFKIISFHKVSNIDPVRVCIPRRDFKDAMMIR